MGLSPRLRPVALSTAITITPVRTIDASDLAGAWRDMHRYRNLSAALDMMAGEEEHYLRGHIVRLGRQTLMNASPTCSANSNTACPGEVLSSTGHSPSLSAAP